MRPPYFLVCALLLPAAIGCSDSRPPFVQPPPPTPTTVHLKSEVTPLLVAYRDGFTDDKGVVLPWASVPTAMLSTSIDLKFGEEYTIAVVCMTGGGVLTWQVSRTISEDKSDKVPEPTVQTPCNGPAPATSAVTGTLVKAGAFQFGDAGTPLDPATGIRQQAAGSAISANVVDGMYDLIASDPGDKKALIRRNVTVSGTTNLGMVNVDTDAETVPLSPVASLTLDNPPKPLDATHTETVQAEISVTTANTTTPGQVFTATYDLTSKKVSAFAYPTAMLTADDVQNATFIGFNKLPKTNITTTRLQTRPLDADAAAGNTTFQLPAAISRPSWGVDPQNRLSVALPSLPALDDLTLTTSGLASDGTTPVTYQIFITASYFGDTNLARPLFDTTLPSFSAAWKIDFTKAYTRDIVSQHDVTDDNGNVLGHETSMFHEAVPAP